MTTKRHFFNIFLILVACLCASFGVGYLFDRDIISLLVANSILVVILVCGLGGILVYGQCTKFKYRHLAYLLFLIIAVKISVAVLRIFPLRSFLDIIGDVSVLVFSLMLFMVLVPDLKNWLSDIFAPIKAGRDIESLIDSQALIDAIESGLPSEQIEDGEGLGYIKYMLVNIERRRAEFARQARLYQRIFISISFGFCVFVGGAGYYMINEDAAGVGAHLRDATAAINSLDYNFTKNRGATVSRLLENHLREIKSMLERAGLSADLRRIFNKELVPIISQTINDARLSDFKKLMDALHNFRQKLIMSATREGSTVIERFDLAVGNLREDGDLIENQLETLPKLIAQFNSQLKLIDDIHRKPENRIADTVKRLSISILVGSLIFVILKFFSNLYQQYLRETIRIQREEMDVRRTAISLVATKNDVVGHRSVVLALMKYNNADESPQSGSAVDLDRGEQDSLSLFSSLNKLLKQFIKSKE